MTTVVSIHQPNYLPWLGYFPKMTYSDMFVFLDAVQYSSHTYINRSYVRQGKERVRLSVPVRTERWDGPINEVRFDTRRFARKHLATMRFAYQKSPWFDEIMALLEPHYAVGETNLADFNIGLITSLTAYLSLSLRFFRMSELGISATGNQLLIDVTRACEGDIYVSGIGAKSYIVGHEQCYEQAGLSLAYHRFTHPEYRPMKLPFQPGNSIVDLLFCVGPQAREILTSQDEPSFEFWRGK